MRGWRMLRTIQAKAARVAEFAADHLTRGGHGLLHRLVFLYEAHPRDGFRGGVELPQPDQPAAAQDGVEHEISDAAQLV